jgi:hypothetical protein
MRLDVVRLAVPRSVMAIAITRPRLVTRAGRGGGALWQPSGEGARKSADIERKLARLDRTGDRATRRGGPPAKVDHWKPSAADWARG